MLGLHRFKEDCNPPPAECILFIFERIYSTIFLKSEGPDPHSPVASTLCKKPQKSAQDGVKKSCINLPTTPFVFFKIKAVKVIVTATLEKKPQKNKTLT